MAENFKAPMWSRFPGIETPSAIEWRQDDINTKDVFIAGHRIGWLEKRPHYCDRGHWKFESELPHIDFADGFPRYYMSETRAIEEIEAWLKWRLWGIP